MMSLSFPKERFHPGAATGSCFRRSSDVTARSKKILRERPSCAAWALADRNSVSGSSIVVFTTLVYHIYGFTGNYRTEQRIALGSSLRGAIRVCPISGTFRSVLDPGGGSRFARFLNPCFDTGHGAGPRAVVPVDARGSGRGRPCALRRGWIVQDYGERGPPIHSKGFASCFRLPFRSANPAAPPTWAQCRLRPSEARGARNPGKPRGPARSLPLGHHHQACEIASSLRPSLGSSR